MPLRRNPAVGTFNPKKHSKQHSFDCHQVDVKDQYITNVEFGQTASTAGQRKKFPALPGGLEPFFKTTADQPPPSPVSFDALHDAANCEKATKAIQPFLARPVGGPVPVVQKSGRPGAKSSTEYQTSTHSAYYVNLYVPTHSHDGRSHNRVILEYPIAKEDEEASPALPFLDAVAICNNHPWICMILRGWNLKQLADFDKPVKPELQKDFANCSVRQYLDDDDGAVMVEHFRYKVFAVNKPEVFLIRVPTCLKPVLGYPVDLTHGPYRQISMERVEKRIAADAAHLTTEQRTVGGAAFTPLLLAKVIGAAPFTCGGDNNFRDGTLLCIFQALPMRPPTNNPNIKGFGTHHDVVVVYRSFPPHLHLRSLMSKPGMSVGDIVALHNVVFTKANYRTVAKPPSVLEALEQDGCGISGHYNLSLGAFSTATLLAHSDETNELFPFNVVNDYKVQQLMHFVSITLTNRALPYIARHTSPNPPIRAIMEQARAEDALGPCRCVETANVDSSYPGRRTNCMFERFVLFQWSDPNSIMLPCCGPDAPCNLAGNENVADQDFTSTATANTQQQQRQQLQRRSHSANNNGSVPLFLLSGPRKLSPSRSPPRGQPATDSFSDDSADDISADHSTSALDDNASNCSSTSPSQVLNASPNPKAMPARTKAQLDASSSESDSPTNHIRNARAAPRRDAPTPKRKRRTASAVFAASDSDLDVVPTANYSSAPSNKQKKSETSATSRSLPNRNAAAASNKSRATLLDDSDDEHNLRQLLLQSDNDNDAAPRHRPPLPSKKKKDRVATATSPPKRQQPGSSPQRKTPSKSRGGSIVKSTKEPFVRPNTGQQLREFINNREASNTAATRSKKKASTNRASLKAQLHNQSEDTDDSDDTM